MQSIKPPQTVDVSPDARILFLAGSIEMGDAVDWQTNVEQQLAHTDWVVLNPRRDEWNDDWKQSISNPQFKEQVEWELDGMDRAEKILMYFDPATKSPITLLELGLHTHGGKLVVCCPDGYWRQGNVDIVCARYNVPCVRTLDEALALIGVVSV